MIRGLFNYAIEDGLLDSNPATASGSIYSLGKDSRLAHEQGGPAVPGGCSGHAPDYYPLLLMAVRAGLRRGELVALQRGDVQLGWDEADFGRFIMVQHNYVRREHTTTDVRLYHWYMPERPFLQRRHARVRTALASRYTSARHSEPR